MDQNQEDEMQRSEMIKGIRKLERRLIDGKLHGFKPADNGTIGRMENHQVAAELNRLKGLVAKHLAPKKPVPSPKPAVKKEPIKVTEAEKREIGAKVEEAKMREREIIAAGVKGFAISPDVVFKDVTLEQIENYLEILRTAEAEHLKSTSVEPPPVVAPASVDAPVLVHEALAESMVEDSGARKAKKRGKKRGHAAERQKAA